MIQNPLAPTYGVSRRNELLSVPVLNAENELQLPVDLDRWMHLGTMLGPQYTDEGFDARGPNLFH